MTVDPSSRLNLDPAVARSLIREILAETERPAAALYNPGEQLPGTGGFIYALNSCLERFADRSNELAAGASQLALRSLRALEEIEDIDNELAHRLRSLE